MKRFISLFICIILVLTSQVTLVSARNENNFSFGYGSFYEDNHYNLGDVNNDSGINAIDAYTMKAYITGITENINIDAADFSADGSISSVDVLYLKTVLSGQKNILDYDSTQRVYKLTINGIDISKFDIVLPETTTYDDNIYFAYELLLNYIEKTTGIKLNKSYGKSSMEHGIYLYDVSGTEMGVRFGDDGFRYEVINGNLNIYGTMRGCMYAAYDFIEKYLGILFYDNVYILSEKVRSSNLPEGFVKEEIPGFSYRFVYSTCWGSAKERTTLARRINAAPLLGDSDNYYGNCQGSRFLSAHSYWYYICMGRGEMPENDGTKSFSELYEQKFINGGGNNTSDTVGQPCAVDDIVFDTLYSGLLDTINMCIARGYNMIFENGIITPSFSMNDSTSFCTCRLCKAIATGSTAKRVSAESYKNLASWYSGESSYNSSTKEATFKKEGYWALYIALANRAAEKIQEVYPGIFLETLVYGSTVPESITTSGHLVLDYCGSISGCVNHRFGEDICNITGAVRDDPNFHSLMDDEACIDYWVGETQKYGGRVVCGIYASDNFTFYLYDIPSYFDLYYDIQWLYEHGVTGVADDSPNSADAYNGFEFLKSKLFAELEWNPTMSFDEYTEIIKKYLHAIYGEGYEHVYNYLVELCNANEAITICVPMYAGAFDFYSKSYIREHYEYMRSELQAAIAEQGNSGRCYFTNLTKLFMTCEVLGLSACYDTMYTNGDTTTRKIYEERYNWLYNYLITNKVVLSSEPAFSIPSSISYDKSPLVQFYRIEHRYKSVGYISE